MAENMEMDRYRCRHRNRLQTENLFSVMENVLSSNSGSWDMKSCLETCSSISTKISSADTMSVIGVRSQVVQKYWVSRRDNARLIIALFTLVMPLN